MGREQLILQAAEKLFSERSFDGVGVDAIGKQAGIVGSGVYRHFAGKEEILAALMDQATDALLEQLSEPKDDPREELDALIRGHVEFALTHERLADIWQRQQHILREAHQRSFVRRQRRYVERWLSGLDACYPGHQREDLLVAVRAMHALIMSDTSRRAGAKRSPHLAELLTNLARASLDGLAVRVESRTAS